MANLRIRALLPTTTPPADAVLPLDADSLSAARRITPKDLVDSTWYVQLGNVAATNTINLDAALDAYKESGNKRGTLYLPRGAYHLQKGFTLTAVHSGLTIEGDGCSLFTDWGTYPLTAVIVLGFNTDTDPMGRGDGIAYTPPTNQFTLTEGNIDNYQVNDAVILYDRTFGGEGRNPIQQVAVITAVDVASNKITIDTNVLSGTTGATFLYNGRKLESGAVPAGATSLTIPGLAAAALFPKQSWAYVTDGVGHAETYGEFVRVKNVVAATNYTEIHLEGALRNSYSDGRAAVVPPGRWVENVTIRGLTLGGSREVTQNTDLIAKFCVNLNLERVACRLTTSLPYTVSNGMLIVTSGHVTLRDCDTAPALAFNTTRDILVENSTIAPACDEFCSDVTYQNCKVVREFRHALGSVRVRAVGCQISNTVLANLLDDSELYDCDVRAMQAENGNFYISGDRVTVQNVRAFDGPLRLLFQSGTGHYVGRLGGNVEVLAGTGGWIDGPVDGTVTAFDPSQGPIALPGSWIRRNVAQLEFTLPTTMYGVHVLGKLGGNQSAIWARITVSAVAYGMSLAREYLIACGWGDTGDNWLRCLPLTGGQQDADDDFDIELRESQNDCWLRVRRTLGTTAAAVIVRIETNAEFTPDGSPPTGSVIGTHQSTALSQRLGRAYITVPFITWTTTVADNELGTDELALWFDPSAKALQIKAKDAGSSVFTGSVELK